MGYAVIRSSGPVRSSRLAGNLAQKHVASPVYLRCQIVGAPLISVEGLYQPAMRLPDRRHISTRLQPQNIVGFLDGHIGS